MSAFDTACSGSYSRPIMETRVVRAERLLASLHAALPGMVHAMARATTRYAPSLNVFDWLVIVGAAGAGAALSAGLRGRAGLMRFLLSYASGASLWLFLCAAGSALPGGHRVFLQAMGLTYLRVALAASAAVCVEGAFTARLRARKGLSRLLLAWAAFFCAGLVRGNALLAAAAAGSAAIVLLVGARP